MTGAKSDRAKSDRYGGATGLIASAQDDEGTLHELWPIFQPEAHQKMGRIIGARPLLVADGHHRYETALAYQAERRLGSPGSAAPATRRAEGYDAVLALVVELSERHLQVLAIHRVVSGLPPGYDLLAALEPGFELAQTAIEGPALLAEMVSAGALAVLLRSGNWLAKPRPGGPLADYDLDSNRVDAALGTLPSHDLVYEHDPGQAQAAVSAGTADAAILCRPATVQQIARTAHGGMRMPPKTTFFWPKPRTGMVLRDFGPA